MRKYIIEGLSEYLAKDCKPWHMPGHKRKKYIEENSGEADINMAAFSGLCESTSKAGEKEGVYNIEDIFAFAAAMDVTEVPGTDDLHHPEEMILKSQQQLARIYGSYSSYYMVNGSTGGILAAIGAVQGEANYNSKKDEKRRIIIARNCHKSVYNACQLFGLEVIYIEPDYLKLRNNSSVGENENQYNSCSLSIYGDIKSGLIKELIDNNPNVIAVVITSPTYEGVISDVAGIKKVLEPYGIPLIVDEAHGAHLPFIDTLPQSAVSLGADLVVQSLHKTLPALTQTAVLHVNSEGLDRGVRKYLSIFMSSSPSYIMLCSMEKAVVYSWEKKQQGGYGEYIKALRNLRDNISKLKNIKLLDGLQNSPGLFAYDETRIVLYGSWNGESLAKRLRGLGNIEIEMSGANCVVLISTYMDKPEDFAHLEGAIKLLDEELGSKEKLTVDKQENPEDAFSLEELYSLEGKVAAENIYVYPPGSYIVAAGEVISRQAIDKLIELKSSGKKIVGL